MKDIGRCRHLRFRRRSSSNGANCCPRTAAHSASHCLCIAPMSVTVHDATPPIPRQSGGKDPTPAVEPLRVPAILLRRASGRSDCNLNDSAIPSLPPDRTYGRIAGFLQPSAGRQTDAVTVVARSAMRFPDWANASPIRVANAVGAAGRPAGDSWPVSRGLDSQALQAAMPAGSAQRAGLRALDLEASTSRVWNLLGGRAKPLHPATRSAGEPVRWRKRRQGGAPRCSRSISAGTATDANSRRARPRPSAPFRCQRGLDAAQSEQNLAEAPRAPAGRTAPGRQMKRFRRQHVRSASSDEACTIVPRCVAAQPTMPEYKTRQNRRLTEALAMRRRACARLRNHDRPGGDLVAMSPSMLRAAGPLRLSDGPCCWRATRRRVRYDASLVIRPVGPVGLSQIYFDAFS